MDNHVVARVDSPFQLDIVGTLDKSKPCVSADHAMARRESSTLSSKISPKPDITFRFVPVQKPGQPRDPKEATKDRSHVMRNFLASDGSRTSKRPNAGRSPEPAKKCRTQDRKSGNRSAISTCNETTSPSTVRKPNHSPERDRLRTSRPNTSATISQHGMLPSTSRDNSNGPSQSEVIKRPKDFIPGRILRHDAATPFLDTSLEQVPYPLYRFNGKLNPFNTLPVFEDSWIDVAKLKRNCSTFFGSKGLTEKWVPVLLRDRRAFLSAMAISTAHDYIMRRSSITVNRVSSATREAWVERTNVSQATQKMIRESLSVSGCSDSTIIAVLHLLLAVLMEGDENLVQIHSRAINAMVEKRGGLRSASFSRLLPRILVLTMLLIATTQDTSPHRMIQEFAAEESTAPPADLIVPIPESPVYCRLAGYVTLRQALASQNPTYHLLDTLRQMTIAFTAKTSQHCVEPSSTEDQDGKWSNQLSILRTKFLSHGSVAHLQFSSVHDRSVYEALHLTAQIYVEALTNVITFGEAASRLDDVASGHIDPSDSTRCARDDGVPARRAIHVRIRDALDRTNMMDCWGCMGGVLLWIVLIAGAAGRTRVLASDTVRRKYLTKDQMEEEEVARQYLVAVAVRTDILLHFEYQSAIMGMLTNLAQLQRLLRRGTEQVLMIGRPMEEIAESSQRLITPQKGMSDFAMELEAVV